VGILVMQSLTGWARGTDRPGTASANEAYLGIFRCAAAASLLLDLTEG
jgi:hypothetical protein